MMTNINKFIIPLIKVFPLKTEKIAAYGIEGRRKGKVVTEEKIKYHYDAGKRNLLRVEYFNIDGTLRKERFLTYNPQGKLSQSVDLYHLEKGIETVDYLYQEGKMWQKITERGDQKSVLVFTKGRPIRLRTYLAGKLQSVVDYGYEYY